MIKIIYFFLFANILIDQVNKFANYQTFDIVNLFVNWWKFHRDIYNIFYLICKRLKKILLYYMQTFQLMIKSWFKKSNYVV